MDWSTGFTSSRRAAMPTVFEAKYNCQSTMLAGKDINEGDKIFLPPSALERLARMNVEYPMLFEVTSCETGKRTHCGVLEFSADEGCCYVPYWMMENLAVAEGSTVKVKNVSLSKANFVKFRARSVDFLEINNPRALLEVTLRKFTCLTVGDTIKIIHLGKHFELDVREVQPNGAASIIETDCNVDFEEPLGYKDSKYAQYEKKAQEAAAMPIAPRALQKARIESDDKSSTTSVGFQPFVGTAKRIDGKLPPKTDQLDAKSDAKSESKNAGSEGKSSSGESTIPKASVPAIAPSFQSSIGDKYSKKKVGVAAFAGAGRKVVD